MIIWSSHNANLSGTTAAAEPTLSGTVEAVRHAYPAVRVVALDSQAGFARALNLGAALGDAPFVLYLNDDFPPMRQLPLLIHRPRHQIFDTSSLSASNNVALRRA